MERILIAAATDSAQAASQALKKDFALTFCTSLVDARSVLKDGFDLILCGLHFDEGRMFDFLREVKADPQTKSIPFLCIKSTDGMLSPAISQSIEIASHSLGANGFVDLFQWKAAHGDEEAYEKFRRLVIEVMGH
jgi:CheY-like chemotaxis protein